MGKVAGKCFDLPAFGALPLSGKIGVILPSQIFLVVYCPPAIPTAAPQLARVRRVRVLRGVVNLWVAARGGFWFVPHISFLSER